MLNVSLVIFVKREWLTVHDSVAWSPGVGIVGVRQTSLYVRIHLDGDFYEVWCFTLVSRLDAPIDLKPIGRRINGNSVFTSTKDPCRIGASTEITRTMGTVALSFHDSVFYSLPSSASQFKLTSTNELTVRK